MDQVYTRAMLELSAEKDMEHEKNKSYKIVLKYP